MGIIIFNMFKNFSAVLMSAVIAGFAGDNIFMAGHSLGGVMAQNYANGNDKVKGLVTMGSVLLRNNHSINSDGTTHWSFDTPTVQINGTKDGLLRISRTAES